MTALEKFLTLCRERSAKGTKGQWNWKRLNPSSAIVWTNKEQVTAKIYIGDAEFICAARTAQPALVEMVEKFQEYLSTDFCICDSDQEYKCDFCELNAAIDLLAEQALREMGGG